MAGGSELERLSMEPEALEVLQSWWREVLEWKLEDIAAGKVIKMFDPRTVAALRGPDQGLPSLYVRRCFDPLYEEIYFKGTFANNDWICHLNGNSGVGKSAFLWYFIIRSSVEFKLLRQPVHLLYESSGYIWEFTDDTIQVAERGKVPVATFSKASWHLINQQVPATGAIGPVILLAASLGKSNVKAVKADRQKSVMYMYPWDEDEFMALVQLWKSHYGKFAAEMEAVKDRLQKLEHWLETKWEFGTLTNRMALRVNLAGVPKVLQQVDQLLKEDVKQARVMDAASDAALNLNVLLGALEARVQGGMKRIEAAHEYYRWFGGVVRLLCSDDIETFTSEGFRRRVNESLENTNLLQLLQCVQNKSQGKDISWALLHFLKLEGTSSFSDYRLDFCSYLVQAEFTLALTRMKAQDLELFLKTASDLPQYGVLRGFVFEELSIVHVLHGAMSMTPMIDNKHCNKCKARESPFPGGHRESWVACTVCENWYHFSCVGVTRKQELQVDWQCPSCEGKKREEPLPRRKRLLRYYEGSLLAALREAGADAVKYVWRPVIKNNGAIDFTIPPLTLAQPTVAKDHPVAAKSLKAHIDALRAWNAVYGDTSQLREIALCFFLGESNYDGFGFQSYRDSSRRVTNQAVRGIRQFKVLLRHNIPVPCVEQMDVPDGITVVDDFEQCKFESEPCKSNYFDPEEEINRSEEAEFNKKRKFAYEP